MTALPHAYQGVEMSDDFTAELEAGMEFAARFYANGRRSLIATIPAEELARWDGSTEKAIVSDPDGVDLPDRVMENAAA
jgi:hypothetical protein